MNFHIFVCFFVVNHRLYGACVNKVGKREIVVDKGGRQKRARGKCVCVLGCRHGLCKYKYVRDDIIYHTHTHTVRSAVWSGSTTAAESSLNS